MLYSIKYGIHIPYLIEYNRERESTVYFTVLSLSLSLSPLSATPTQYEFLDGQKYELLTFNPDDGSGLTYQAIFLSPKTTPTAATPPPLVVLPHGGPHTLYSTEFYAWSSCLAALGFAVLFGN